MKNVYILGLISVLTSCTTQQIGLTFPNQVVNNSSNQNLSQSNSSSIEQFKITNDLNNLTVNVNVIILKREGKGPSNFDLNNPEEKAVLTEYFEKINTTWSKFYQPNDALKCYTGSDFYPDPKIRFKFNFKEVTDSYAWNYLNSGADLAKGKVGGISPGENWYGAKLDQKLANDVTLPKGIFVYLTMDGKQFDELYKNKGKGFNISGIEASQFPSATNLTRTSSINVPNRYLKYLMHRYQSPVEFKTTWAETKNWHIGDAIGTAHELGHSLGLSHQNQYHNTNQCSASLMSQNWQHARNYLQPTEILKAHQNLRETNLIQFVTEDSFLGNTFTINTDTNWTKTQRFYSNLNILDHVTLTISEPIIISPQAKISFGKNSKIQFKGNGKIMFPNEKEFTNFVNKTSNSIIKI